jgi:hypothetical protein
MHPHLQISLNPKRTNSSPPANGLPSGPAWGALDDVVMGGISESGFQVDRTGGENGGPVGVFKGRVTRVSWLALTHCSDELEA